MTMTVRPMASAVGSSQKVVAYDGSAGASATPLTPGQVASSKDTVLTDAVRSADRVMSYLKSAWGRDGLDGKGAPLAIVAHAADPMLGGKMNNAFWDGETGRLYVGDGDGRMFSPLGAAVDIIAHETGHAILESELQMGFSGQEGALHESFGDVVGSMLDPDDWQIGEDAFTPGTPGDAIRDMSKPQRYDHMDKVGEDAEVHDLADIPNLAAVRTAEKVGREEMGKIWYTAFTQNLKDHGQFADAAAATVAAASSLYGADSAQASAVKDAWTSVGVLRPAA